MADCPGKMARFRPFLPTLLPPRETWDAQGRLVIPGLVDAHIHLDKALLLSQAPAQTGTFAEAMAETLRLKQHYTVG
jgi:cytosine deaminase